MHISDLFDLRYSPRRAKTFLLLEVVLGEAALEGL